MRHIGVHPATRGEPARAAAPGGARRRVWLLGFAAASGVALLLFLYRYLDAVVSGRPAQLLPPLINELTGVYGSALLLPLLLRFIRAHRLERGRWLRELPAYAGAAVLFGLVHTTLMWGSRVLLFGLVGMPGHAPSLAPVRFAMEFPLQLVVVTLTTAFVHVLDRYRAAREREVRASQREAGLARAQLQVLQAQLQPHFLFNALNTISSMMYEDVDAADRMIARLSELLRHALRTTRAQTISLAEELEILEPYLDLMHARFGDRLEVVLQVADDARGAAVPALLLQPLVENAAQHGVPEPPRPARLVVAARRDADALVVEVEDNGPGVPGGRPLLGRGVGLSNTVARLRALYGDAARLEWGNLDAGGLRVRVVLPYRPAMRAASDSGEEETWSVSAP